MPKYDVDVNGRTYEVDAPDPNTAWAWANHFVADQEATRAARPGFFDAAGRGLESATLGGIRGLQMTAQPDNLALEQRMLESRGPSFTWEDVKSEFKAGDYGRGLSELWGLTKQSTGESLGFMAPALVTGKAAAALTPPVLPVVGPLAKPIAGALGTVAGLLPGMYGTNVERQAGEREAARQAGTPVPEWEFGKAATAAAGQTALDLIMLRASGLHRVAGMGREEALAVARRELQELGAEGFARSLGVGTLRTMAAEVPTEITQQGLERWQAGLPLTGEDAMKEYEASAVGAALSSPVFGAVGRRVEVGQARRQEAALVAKEQQAQQQRAAAQAALQARQDAFNALSPGTQQEMPLTQFEGPMRPSGDFTPPTPESFTQERTNTANRLMNMQAEIDRLRQEGRIGEAAALKERYFQEEAKFNEMGGVTPGQLSKLRNDVAQAQEKLTKGQERLLSAQTKEEYDNISKGLGKQQERLAQLTQQLQQVEAANAYTSPETGGAQLQLDMERNEQAERIQAAIQSGNEYILGYDEVNALGVPRAGGAKRRISLLDLAQPEARVEARKIVEESAKNAEAKARFLQTLDRIDADIARAKEQATAAPTTSELQVDDTQQGRLDFGESVAASERGEGLTSAELEPEQQADPEYEAFLRERARQQAERVKSPAQRAAEAREAQMKAEGRWTDADEQRAREEEAMWAAQRQQEIEATPYGTQFELTAPGSMPVRSQQRQQEVEQVPPTMRDLATQYIAARNEKNAELMQAIETTAKSINPEQWKKIKYEYITSGRKQTKLDFEGAAQPVPGDTRAGGQADVQRPAAEPSVGVPVQPEQPAAAQVEEPAGPGVGDVERPAGRRDAPEKPKRRTLKEKRDAVQEQKPDEGVLRREEPEMGLQEVGEGDAKPQEAAQEGKGEVEVDSAQLVKDLQDVSSKEGNSSAGQRARKYLLEARNGTGSPKEASDFVADYRIAAARAPKPKRVPAVQAPQPPKQKTIADYEAELDAEYERDDGPRQAVVTALENKIAAMQRGAGTVAKGVAADVAEAEGGRDELGYGNVIEGEYAVIDDAVPLIEEKIDDALTPEQHDLVTNDPQLGNGNYDKGRKKLAQYVADSMMGKSIAHLKKAIQKLIKQLQNGAMAMMVAFNFNTGIPVGVVNVNVFNVESAYVTDVNLNGAEISNTARRVAEHALNRGNGKAFVVVDKPNAMMYAFDKDGNLLGKTPVLLGKSSGDLIGDMSKGIDQMTDVDKITPSGAFTGRQVADPEYGTRVQLDETLVPGVAVIAIHRVYLGTPSEQRQQRLDTQTNADNRVSYGCINVPSAFYDSIMAPNFVGTSQIYVTPETRSAKTEFGLEDDNVVRTTGKTGTVQGDSRTIVGKEEGKEEGGSFSGSTDKPSGTTVAKVVSAIKRAFFNPSSFDNKVTVVQSVNDLPPAIARKFKEAEAKGLYGSAYFDGRRVYIVADQTPESDILGVVLHDVGVHMGMKNLLGEELHKQLLNQIEKWAKPGTGLEHQIAARALARAGVNEKAGVASNDEVLAYFVEEAVAAGINPTALKGASPLTQWFRKLWAAAKAAIRRLGINPDKLTAQDVVDMAYGAARMELAGTWHGTAARFRKFDHKYMGSGEGAQAFGWGTYLAQRFGIGKGYWQADVERKQFSGVEEAIDKWVEAAKAGKRGAYSESEITSTAKDMRSDPGGYEEILSEFGMKPVDGSLMRVDTNIQDDELLDWDKPLSEQSELVKKALEGTADFKISDFANGQRGEQLYRYIERKRGSDKAASEYLDSIGIKGIKFLDHRSRYMAPVEQLRKELAEVEAKIADAEAGSVDPNRPLKILVKDKANLEKDIYDAENPSRNLVIFNDKNIQRVFTDVGAKETQRSFSGRATNAKAQAERILADVGRTADMAAPSTMQERVRAITEGVKEPKELGKRAFDWVMTQLDSAYPAQEKLRDAMTADQRAMHEYAVAYGTFAQAGHLNGVAGMALQEGGVSFDQNTGHFVASESGHSGRRLHDLQVEMAKTHGMSYEDARRYTIQAWEGRRTLSLYRERDQRLKDANELEAAGKKKQAAAIRDKWEGMKFHITRDAATKLDSLYQVFPELGEITKVKNGMRKWIMDFVVDSGLLSKEKAELLLDNADWVPFKREFDPDETGSMEQFAMAREAFQPSMMRGRAFRGSERSVTDIMDSFDNWALYMMRTAMRNQATKASVAEFMRYGAAKPTSQTKSAGTENRRVRYFADGKPQYVLFDDAPIAAFFNSNIASPRQSAIMAGFNAIFRKSIIGMPTFSLKQLIVDSQEAIIKSGLPAKYAIQIPKLATQEFIKLRSGAATEAHKALTKRGFAGAYTDIAAVRGEELRTVLGYHVTDDKQRSKFMQKWKDAETYGMRMAMHSDNAVRQAIYIAAKDSGMSEAQALNAAADYVNFKRTLSNDTLRAVAAYVPFLTASLSAIRASLMALSGKGITPQERGAALKNYATNMAIVTALSTLWAMANSDDEEYNNMSPEQRARQWTLPGTGGFGIPRRVSVESVVPILSELAVNQMTDKAVDATRMRKATFGLLGEALMPIPEPVPAPVKVLVEQVTNYNSFTGDPVVGTTLNKQDAWKQYGANTSAAARAVGEGMESVGLGNFWFASPTRIDHITRGLLGSVGASGLLLSNMIASKAGDRPEMSTKDLLASIPGFSIPAAKEFNQSDRNDFYDLAERLDKVASTANALLSEGRVEEYQDYVEKNRDKLAMDKAVGRMMDQLNKIRRATKMVRESSMPGRDDEIRRLREVEMRLIQNLNVKGLRVAAGI